MAVQKRYINQLVKVWNDLMHEAEIAMNYVDCDNDCNDEYVKVLDRLQDRFDKALAHIEE